jgi:hypothetical protein
MKDDGDGSSRASVPIPALDTPPLKPWNEFDHEASAPYAELCRRLAEIVADDEWHDWNDLIADVAPETLGLADKTVQGAIRQMAARGDLRIWRKHQYRRAVRLTTRWQGYRSDYCSECGGAGTG